MGSLIARRHSLHRESEESFIHSSQDVVESYMSEVIDCITRSVAACPLALRIVLRNTYLRVRFKWSHETYEVEYCFVLFAVLNELSLSSLLSNYMSELFILSSSFLEK